MWKTITISKKIWLCVGIVLLGYFGSTVFGFFIAKQTESRLITVSACLFPASRFSQAVVAAFDDQIELYTDAIITGDDALMADAQGKSEEVQTTLAKIFQLSDIDSATVATIEDLIQDMEDFTRQAGVVYLPLAMDETVDGMDLQVEALSLSQETRVIQEALHTLAKGFGDALTAELASANGAILNQQHWNIGLFCAIALSAMMLTSLIVTRFIVRPIHQAVEMLKNIATGEGDLTQRLEIRSRDEVGEMGRWFNQFIENIREIIIDIAAKAEGLNGSASDLNGLSTELSGGSKSLTAKSASVTTAAEEMSRHMMRVASISEEASVNISSVAGTTGEMNASLVHISTRTHTARSATEGAVEKSREMALQIKDLGSSADEIGEVTQVIAAISAQTNLLALNAKIEAVRAGDAGRGFVVVANEIKALAAQTDVATQEIKAKIENIQRSTRNTRREIGEITGVISQVNEAVTSIAVSVEEQARTTEDIVSNINRAADGIHEANESVSQTSQVSQGISMEMVRVDASSATISHSSQKIQTSSTELFTLAEQLKMVVQRFIF